MLKTIESKILLRWWQSLMLSEQELKNSDGYVRPAPSGEKAKLKRASSVEAVMMQDAFRSLWLQLPEDTTKRTEDLERWAVIATVLMYVSPGHVDNLAKAAGHKQEISGKSIVSEMRFSQLQAAKTPNELLRTLRRLLQLIKGKTDPLLLANDIDQWFYEYNQSYPRQVKDRIAVRWAMDYYRSAK